MNLKIGLLIIIIVFGVIATLAFFYIIFSDTYFHYGQSIDADLADKFGSFFSGFVGTLFTIVSILLIIYSMHTQNIQVRKAETIGNFFKMLDYHNQNVSDLRMPDIDINKKDINEGRRAFVNYKIQLKRLLEIVIEENNVKQYRMPSKEIIDIAYMVFYYGLDTTWISFINEKVARYPNGPTMVMHLLNVIESNRDIKIGRTNQTGLSSYFRNMYGAIKLVDESKLISPEEKRNLIKIYRAQLSNPELYILFYNVISRFGKKWNANNYITKYEFIKNLPKGYADLFNPKDFYDIPYEDEE
ncbi:putative phage abortive infection protein [Mucilaginibacter myungsuensis]|uniref:Phage abortive infection protein n=1 Tax=Mucilaginibacter myungsuensis TaxID=649104 RepID=A0A929PXE2_9SPHI|nr:putative phage abortive infection protein [Mucilaginibacter myungsuensis]MBE9663768.1 putative phage abortive infection protein [Mucilaginibacter myungsuensis]MDN3598906.1 putative phage abortive infection protein [Mucilaginibacter myungsuensis]